LPSLRRCRPQGSCPSRRFWQRARIVSHSSRSTPFSVTPRRFAALFHAARVPGDALQSFPLSRSRTCSRRPVLPCGFAFDRRRRDEVRASSVLSPWRRPFAAAGPKARRTHGPGSGFPAPPGEVRRTRRSAPTAAPPRSRSSGSPVNGRHAHFEALLSSGVRSRGDPRPGQGEVVGSVLSWACFPSRVCSSRIPGPVSRVDPRGAGRTRVPREPPGIQTPRVVHETRIPVQGSSPLDPPACAVDRTTPATVRRRSSGGAFAAHRRQSPAPSDT
jgi:hypothetical protein